MKKVISLLLSFVMILSMISIVQAADNSRIGDNVYWDFDDGVLTISGYGEIYDVTNVFKVPWFDFESEVRKIVIEEGITYIGDNAFCWHGAYYGDGINIEEIYIPSTVRGLGNCTFAYIDGVDTVYYNAKDCVFVGNSLTYAYNYFPSGKKLVIGKDVEKIGANVFYRGEFDEVVCVGDWDRISVNMTGNETLQNIKEVSYEVENYDEEVTVYVDDRRVIFDQHPIIQNGRTLVPVRATCEAMDIVVEWTQQIQEVRLTKDDREFVMRIGQSRYYTNKYGEGIYDYFDVPPQIVNGRTLLPIRAIAEFFGYKVSWVESTRSVIIEDSLYSGNIWEDDTTPEVSWDEPEINFEDYIGVWDTFSSRYAQFVDVRIRIADVDLRNQMLDIDYKVDRDSESHLTMNDKLTIEDYPYERLTLNYYEKTLSNGKTALVTDVFELLDGDKVTIILDEDGNLGLGNSLGHSIIRNLE